MKPTITINITILPAFYSLQDTVEDIWAEEGEDVALEWFSRTFHADQTLFIRTSSGPSKPNLRLIDGGAQ